jgi:voltage-gated potassium channel
MPDSYEPPTQSSAPDSRGRGIETVERALLARRRQQRKELQRFTQRLVLLLAVVLVVVIGGSVAYSIAEQTSLAYGVFWTLDAVTTLGEIGAPKDTGGRLILVVLELLGIGTLSYGLATVAQFFVSGQLAGALEYRRTQKMIDSYSNHYIVCGYGRVGRQVALDLKQQSAPVVVIDHNPMHREEATADGVAYIEGHASDDDVLLQAGIERATAVIACVDSDAENIFVTLSARELSRSVKVIARASADDAERKLLRAGANEVISPYKMTGSAMARLALEPEAASTA